MRDLECWALAEPEYMEEMNWVGSVPIYKQFESSLIAEKKPEKVMNSTDVMVEK